MKSKIKRHILDELVVHAGRSELGDDDDLLISNLLDSLGVMRLVEYLEQQNEITIPAEDITLENFQSINTITRYLAGKTGTQPPAPNPET